MVQKEQQLSQAPARAMQVKLYAVVFTLLIAFAGYIVYNLFNTAVLKSDYYRSKANSQQLSGLDIKANRGDVYDRNGKILAKSTTVWTVVLSPYDIEQHKDAYREFRVKQAQKAYDEAVAEGRDAVPVNADAVYDEAQEICKMLSNVLGVSYERLMRVCENKTLQYEIVKKKIGKEEHDKIVQFKEEKGIGYFSITLVEDSLRAYPHNMLASNIIGFTDYDNKGIYGIEAYYDDELTGVDGRIVKLKDASSRTLTNNEYEQRYDAKDGNSLVLTVDSVLQHYLEKSLEKTISQHKVANRATGIMMNPQTGAVLAMATTLGYDLNNPSVLNETDRELLEQLKQQRLEEMLLESGADELSDEEAAQLEEEMDRTEADLREKQWKNKAITELYFPGSVFKVITCASALEEKVVDLNWSHFCAGKVEVADTTIGCWEGSGHGILSLQQAVTKSCNPCFIEISRRLGANRFSDYFEAFGFTQKTGIDLPGESSSLYMPREKMGKVELATSAFGQTNKITPLQMITAYAAVVNGGYLVTPHVVDKIVDGEGNIIKTMDTQIKRQVISAETSETMRYILEEVVKANGGSNAFISGYRIGGKSGTSEKIDEYGNSDYMRYVASFCAFSPADAPEVIMLVIVDEPNPGGAPYYGSMVAAPVVSDVFRECFRYLEIYPQFTAEEQAAMGALVPNIVGLSPLDATARLNTEGLEKHFVGEGTKVLRTVPAAGQLISRNGTVVVYLDEQDYVTTIVPYVYNLTVAEANRLIAEAGLNIRLLGGAVDNASAKASSMSIEPGTMVNKGTVIEVMFIADEGYGG